VFNPVKSENAFPTITKAPSDVGGKERKSDKKIRNKPRGMSAHEPFSPVSSYTCLTATASSTSDRLNVD
jgi:hypothetical protein